MTRRIVVVGDLMVDVVATMAEPLQHASDTAASVVHRGGGVGANVAAWLIHAGAAASLITRVGDDAAGREQVAALEAAGVTVHAAVDPCRPTGTCVVLVHPGGERSMLPDRGAGAGLAPEDVADDVLGRAPGHVHLSGYVLLHRGSRAAGARVLTRAREQGLTTSVDPASAAPLRAMGADAFLQATGPVDLLIPNAEEAQALTAHDDPARAAQALIDRGAAREVVVTLGDHGALWTDGREVLHCPAEPSTAVDTTGAGDAFSGGYLAARAARLDPHEALRRATAIAAIAVRHAGARPTHDPAEPKERRGRDSNPR